MSSSRVRWAWSRCSSSQQTSSSRRLLLLLLLLPLAQAEVSDLSPFLPRDWPRGGGVKRSSYSTRCHYWLMAKLPDPGVPVQNLSQLLTCSDQTVLLCVRPSAFSSSSAVRSAERSCDSFPIPVRLRHPERDIGSGVPRLGDSGRNQLVQGDWSNVVTDGKLPSIFA